MAKWPNFKIIRVLVPPEVLYNHMWAVMNAYNRVDFEFPVAIRASLPSATTCLERPYLLGPLGGRYIQVLLYLLLSLFLCVVLVLSFLACSRACASKVFSLRADCGRVIVYPGLKQWERPRHNIFGVCTRLAGGVCMSTSANSSASKHLTVTKIVWKIVYVTFDYLISHFFKILSLEFMANLFRDFRASVSLKVFHYRLRGKWCQYDLEIN